MGAVPVVPLIHTDPYILTFKLRNLIPVLPVGIGLFPYGIRYLLHMCQETASMPVLAIEVLTDEIHAL